MNEFRELRILVDCAIDGAAAKRLHSSGCGCAVCARRRDRRARHNDIATAGSRETDPFFCSQSGAADRPIAAGSPTASAGNRRTIADHQQNRAQTTACSAMDHAWSFPSGRYRAASASLGDAASAFPWRKGNEGRPTSRRPPAFSHRVPARSARSGSAHRTHLLWQPADREFLRIR